MFCTDSLIACNLITPILVDRALDEVWTVLQKRKVVVFFRQLQFNYLRTLITAAESNESGNESGVAPLEILRILRLNLGSNQPNLQISKYSAVSSTIYFQSSDLSSATETEEYKLQVCLRKVLEKKLILSSHHAQMNEKLKLGAERK